MGLRDVRRQPGCLLLARQVGGGKLGDFGGVRLVVGVALVDPAAQVGAADRRGDDQRGHQPSAERAGQERDHVRTP